MKFTIKIFAVAIALLMVLAAFAACGSVPANTVFSEADLAGKKIGVQSGTTGADIADTYKEKGATVERYTKANDAILALKQGKIDCVIIDNQPAAAFVAANSDLKILDDVLASELYAIAVKKGNTELTELLNGALKTIKENGTLQKIYDNWCAEEGSKVPYTYTSPENVDRSAGTLKIATSPDFPPYESMEGDKVVGFDADMIQAMADIIGYNIVWDCMNFDSVIASVASGKTDIGLSGLTIKPDRLESVDFTDSYIEATQVIIVRAK